jgi:hypothetical protein
VRDERTGEPSSDDFDQFAAPLAAVTDPAFLGGAEEGRTNGLGWAIELVLQGDRSG